MKWRKINKSPRAGRNSVADAASQVHPARNSYGLHMGWPPTPWFARHQDPIRQHGAQVWRSSCCLPLTGLLLRAITSPASRCSGRHATAQTWIRRSDGVIRP